jgi:hypothetical protein
MYSETSQNWQELGPKNYHGRFRGVAGFMRLPLRRIAQQGLKKIGRYSGRACFMRVHFREVSLYYEYTNTSSPHYYNTKLDPECRKFQTALNIDTESESIVW